jgi:hypothetical protein
VQDEAPLGRPPVDFLDLRILVRLGNEPYRSMQSAVQALNASRSTIVNHFHDLLEMKHLQFRYFPDRLNRNLRETRCEKYRELDTMLGDPEQDNSAIS